MTNRSAGANRAREIFSEAIEHHAPSEWPNFLQFACGADAALRHQVQRLLDAHQQMSAFMANPPAGHSETELMQQHEDIGDWIDRYRLREQLGEGGMGRVFVAEQSEPVRRRVALKIIKPGMDTRHVVARFEAERQALAVMDHPNIAKVLDGGSTKLGRPYFVMELVRGMPITAYCDKARLTPRQRLELFVMVCEAVQHAHQKGIIHRDLKPSNILITVNDGRPLPKVIDFGIAKALGQQLTDNTLYTGFMQMLGTPVYMSPEQTELSGQDVDTRSDVYSLGVLLYELLTGATPFDSEDLKKVGFDEMRRMIREVEPPTPSRRISTLDAEAASTLSEKRGIDQRQFNRMLRGELDWIVMKALDKDRNRRYSSPETMARDIENHLHNRPVEACPPSAVYRCKKFVRRNRGVLIASALVTGALIAGTAISTWQAVRATYARESALKAVRAEKAARRAEGEALTQAKLSEASARKELAKFQVMYQFLTGDLLSQAEPGNNAVEDKVTLLETLDRAAEKVGQRYVEQPDLEITLRTVIANTYHSLGSFKKAEQQWQAVESLATREFGENDYRLWMAISSRGHMMRHLGDHQAAVELSERGYAGLRRTLSPEHPETILSLEMLALVLLDLGRYEQAVRHCEEVVRIRETLVGSEHPDSRDARMNLAAAYYQAGEWQRAIELFEKILRSVEGELGKSHPDTLGVKYSLAVCYDTISEPQKALSLLEEVLPLRKSILGEDHPDTLATMGATADAYNEMGRYAEAISLREETLRLQQAVLWPDHPDTLVSMQKLARDLLSVGRATDALPIAKECLRLSTERLGPNHLKSVSFTITLGWTYVHLGQANLAESLADQSLKQMEIMLGRNHDETLAAMSLLARVYVDQRKLDAAIPIIEEWRERGTSLYGAEHPHTVQAVELLANVYETAGQYDKAITLLMNLSDYCEQAHGKDSPEYAQLLARTAFILIQQSRHAEAETKLRQCLAIREAKQPDDWPTYNTKSMLGAALLGQSKLAEAEPLLLAGYEGMKAREETIPPVGRTRLVEAVQRLAELYTALNKPDDAEKWRALLPAPAASEAADMQ